MSRFQKTFPVIAFLYLAPNGEIKCQTALVHMIPGVVGHQSLASFILIHIPWMVQNKVRIDINIAPGIFQLWINKALDCRICAGME